MFLVNDFDLAPANSDVETCKELGFPWLPIKYAPRDGTPVILAIRLQHGVTNYPVEDVEPSQFYRTMGHNTFDFTEVDEWDVVGWDWGYDHYLMEKIRPEYFQYLPALESELVQQYGKFEPDKDSCPLDLFSKFIVALYGLFSLTLLLYGIHVTHAGITATAILAIAVGLPALTKILLKKPPIPQKE